MRYQVGGSLRCDDPTYVVRSSDEQLYAGLKAGDFCYVLNSRQMGKSSLLQRTSHRLEKEGYRCAYIDVTRLGSEETTPLQWYKGIIISLFYGLNLAEKVNFKQWWAQQTELSPVQRLHQFVEEVLLPGIENDRLIIFVDEIDSLLSLKFPVNDFFAWIRHCYNLRANDSNFERLGFALFGVASPSDLISDKRRTPFNIGKAIELYGFQLHEIGSLLQGLEGIVAQPETLLREILYWTGGQPFLTQKICNLVLQTALDTHSGQIILPPGTEEFWVEQLVRERIIQHWESQDEPEHLRTIRDRLLFNESRAGRLLGLIQKILQAEEVINSKFSEIAVPTDDSPEQTELLLSGLVEKHKGYLRIKNPIYRHVFNSQWVVKQLNNLRPYSQTFNAWVASNFQDQSRLLRGQALADAQKWTQGKSLSDLDYKFLAASQEEQQREIQLILEAARAKEVQARLAQEKKTAKFQRYLLMAVGIKLIISMGLGLGILILYQQAVQSEKKAKVSELKALISSSEGLFASNRRLDALIEAIKAKERSQDLNHLSPKIESQINNVLRQAVYGADEYNRFSGHQAAVLAVAVSPDSSLIASASVDKTVKLWRKDGTEIATLTGHTAIVRTVTFSPDGRLIVSGGDDGTLLLWKQNRDKTYSLLKKVQGHQGGIWGIAFSPDNQTLASASFDRTVKLWQPDGTLIKTFEGYNAGFWGIAFSPDSQIVAATSLDKTIKLSKRDPTGWQQAKPFQTLQSHTSWVASVAFSPDGKTLVSSSEDKTVKLWKRDDKDGNYRLSQTLSGHNAAIWGVAISPDGQTIASASLDKTIKLWSIQGTELRTLKGHCSSVWGVTFSPDGRFIASAGAENLVKLWQSENPFQKTIIAHQAGTWSVAISSDSSMIATLSHENTPKLWSPSGQLLQTLSSSRLAVAGLSFAQKDQLIAFGDEGDTVYFWKPGGTPVGTYKSSKKSLFTVALSPDGQTLATAYMDKTIQLIPRNQESGETSSVGRFPDIRKLANPKGDRRQETEDRTQETGVYRNKTIKLIPRHSSVSKPKTLKGHQAEIWQLQFSPDSQLLGSASSDGTAKLWTLDGKLFRTLAGHASAVWKLAFSHDSKMIATASGDNTVKLWTLDGKEIKTFVGHQAAVWGVAFSPDDQMIASGSVDTTLKLWKRDGTEITTLTGHSAAVRSIDISPDGSFLASLGDDNTLIIWNLPQILNLKPLESACRLVQDYLKTNITLEESDRLICDQLGKKQ